MCYIDFVGYTGKLCCRVYSTIAEAHNHDPLPRIVLRLFEALRVYAFTSKFLDTVYAWDMSFAYHPACRNDNLVKVLCTLTIDSDSPFSTLLVERHKRDGSAEPNARLQVKVLNEVKEISLYLCSCGI